MDLSQQAKDSLRVLATSPGYQVLLNLIEGKVHDAETDLLKTAGFDTPKIVAAHNRAKAYWELFESMQRDVAAASEVLVESKPLTPLEIIQASL